MALSGALAWSALALALAAARELDPAACAPRFDVQRDKIIRTEESRDMGARYLSELDVGARAECLRLCCETDACDVFVYEEKGAGSCYLFNCGPPEDFRCKFTAHSNFSSGVLALSRRLAELQDQERLAHHERELASLRSGTSSTARAPPPAPAAPPPASPAPAPAQPHATHPLLTEIPPSSACSRYQFACRRGAECIAVYNACDGVPQCADGSDEAPELGCPPRPARPAAPAAPPSPKPQESMEGNMMAGGAAEAGGERWPHRLAQAQPQHRYDEGATGPHIFSHKGGLVQEEGALPFAPFEPAWPRRAWPQPQPQPQPGAEGERAWGGPGAGAGAGAGYAWPAPRRAWPVPPLPRAQQEVPEYLAPPEYARPPHDAAKKGPEPRPSAPAEPEPERETEHEPESDHEPKHERPPPLHNTTNKKLVKDNSPAPSSERAPPGREREREHEHAAAHRHYTDEHEAPAERAPAAVLLLVLGVAMTAGVGGAALCRARAARRRRARPPYAHDADYLVNGMYL